MRAALGLLTTVGGARRPSPRALPWFPFVGLAVGAAVGGVWWAIGEVAPLAIAAAAAVVADLALTGLLHADGVADTADGLLPPLVDRDRRLEVMADPHPGSFGVVAIVAVLLARFAAFASIEPDVLAVAGMWALSRGVMGAALAALPGARPGGLADAFAGGSPVVPALVGLVAGVALAGWATAGVLVGSACVLVLAMRRLAGVTGDVLGAAGMVGETFGLAVLAAVAA